MKNYLLFFFLGVGSLAFAQGVFVPQQTAFKVVNGYTTPIANASITVCAANTSGIPCSPALVNAIFKDAALTQALSNPFTSDAFGNYQFASAGGAYTVTVTASGFVGSSYQVSTAGGIGAIPNPLNAVNLNVSGATNLNGFSSQGPGNWSNGFPAFGAPADPFCADMVQTNPPWWQLCGLIDPNNGTTIPAWNDNVGTPNNNKFPVMTDTLPSFQAPGAVPCWNPATAAFSFNVPCRLANPPLYVSPGTPTSQGNECAAITTDSSGGGAVTAAAALRSIDGASKAHDVLCVVTADPGNPGQVGTIIFPWNTSFSTNSAASQIAPGQVESLLPTGGVVILTNNGGTTRKNSINFRGCNGPGPTNCGTDFQIVEDATAANKTEIQIVESSDGTPFYIGNVLNSRNHGIYLGGCCADTGAVFGIDRFLGKLSHLVRLAADADAWGTLTLSSGTASYSFDRAFASAPLCFATWQSGTLTGFVKCATTTSGITITSSVGTDNAVIAYMLLGNNN